MPWNEDGSRKNPALYKKSGGFKMAGWSGYQPDPSAFAKKKYSYSTSYRSKYEKNLLGGGKSHKKPSKGGKLRLTSAEGITSRRLPWRPEADRLNYPKRKA